MEEEAERGKGGKEGNGIIERDGRGNERRERGEDIATCAKLKQETSWPLSFYVITDVRTQLGSYTSW
jgi:hypothetical protein